MTTKLPLPIKFDSTSNGEFSPPTLSKREHHINDSASDFIDQQSRYLGMKRRDFLVSSCAAASTLLMANQVNAEAGQTGGYYAVNKDSVSDQSIADSILSGREFIFDIQGHFVDPNGRWLNQVPDSARPFAGLPNASCNLAELAGNRSYLQCLGPERFIKDVLWIAIPT